VLLSIFAIIFGGIAIKYPSVTGIALLVGGILGLAASLYLLLRGRAQARERDASLGAALGPKIALE
jgi:hypothetical protein